MEVAFNIQKIESSMLMINREERKTSLIGDSYILYESHEFNKIMYIIVNYGLEEQIEGNKIEYKTIISKISIKLKIS